MQKMIVEHILRGSIYTSFHDFVMSVNGMNLIFSGGSYYQAGEQLYSSDQETILPLSSPAKDTYYHVWLTKTGFEVIDPEQNWDLMERNDLIDRLSWFTLPAGCTNLDDIQIDFVKIISE